MNSGFAVVFRDGTGFKQRQCKAAYMYFPCFYALHNLRVRKKNRSIIGTNILQHGMHDEILHAANELLI